MAMKQSKMSQTIQVPVVVERFLDMDFLLTTIAKMQSNFS